MIRLLITTVVTLAAIHFAGGVVRASIILPDLDEAAMGSQVHESPPAAPNPKVFEPTDQAGMSPSSVSVGGVASFFVACLGSVLIPNDSGSETLICRERSLHIAPFLQKRLRPPRCFAELVLSNLV